MLMLSFSCQKVEQEKQKAQKYEGALISFTTITTILSEDAKIKLKLFAPLQYVQENGNIDYPKGVQISMYNEDKILITTLRANKGFYDKSKHLYVGTGDVVVENLERRQRLYTEELNWNQPKKEIFTEKPIRILTPTEILEGTGLTSDEEFGRYTIWKPTGIFDMQN